MIQKLYIDFITGKLGISTWQTEQTIELFDEGATIPFIARYRKEKTGALDEAQIAEIKHLYLKFEELEKRKQSILTTIQEQDKLTDDLKRAIELCVDSQELEDIYLPFRPKRKTRASVAKERGLEPLAEAIYNISNKKLSSILPDFLNDDVSSEEEALSGARDIIAEWISEKQSVRAGLRKEYLRKGKLIAKLSKNSDPEKEEVSKYSNYFDFTEDINKMPSHRVLAILRASSEGVLSIKLSLDSDYILDKIWDDITKNKRRADDDVADQLNFALEDAYKRLLHPSIENETLNTIKERADLDSIKVFGENLKQLLLAPPLGEKRVLAIDPGYRTGCKVVCLDEQGVLLHNDTIYPHPPQNERIQATKKIVNMVQSYKIEVIAIGNGTAGRETESFIKRIALPPGVKVFSVNEDGASIYSASAVAREEFPDYDITVRGAVSIGRRLMDPLAELVKIDPKSIGVGQYQHDVDQTLLKERLDDVVESCVNNVGVNINTASKQLLSYVSGIGPVLASNIVAHRTENGPFKSRKEILKVKRLGEKVYEQSAGFLRIPGAVNLLDNTAVHPERYKLVETMAKDMGLSIVELISDKAKQASIDLKKYVTQEVGMPTLNDIMSELAKPGRDPRSGFKVFEFSEEISTIEDVKEGMILPGIITNITNFGAFVDIGIKQNGLIHISHISDKYISSPGEVVKINQYVEVRVLNVDLARNRIQLALVK